MSQFGKGIRRGDWYAYCQVCGRRFFGSTMLNRYDNLFVCSDDWEPRPEADQPIVIVDQRNPPQVSSVTLSNTLLAEPLDATTSENWYNYGQGNIV